MNTEENQTGQEGTQENASQENSNQSQDATQQQDNSKEAQGTGSEPNVEQVSDQGANEEPAKTDTDDTTKELVDADKPTDEGKTPQVTDTAAKEQDALAATPPVTAPPVVDLTPPPPTPVVEQKPAPAAPKVVMEPKQEEVAQIAVKSTDHLDGDSELVTLLKAQLKEFAKVNSRPGRDPKEFKASAMKLLQITKFVIQHPKVDVLDTLLAFFEENIKGVTSAENVMKGSTLLGHSDEQQVGWLVNLFTDLANKNLVRINNQAVTAILKKSEIVGFYNRKVAVLEKAAAAV